MSDYSDKGLQTRERIVRAAAELFYLHGYNATGLERVISAAGVVKGNFYYYFKSKEALAVETLRWHREQTRAALGIDEPLINETPLERFFNVLQKLKVFVLTEGECGVRGCYYGNLALEMSVDSPLVRKELTAVFESFRSFLADLIRRAQEAGEVSSKIDPTKAAAMVLSLVEGAVLLSKTEQNPRQLDDAIQFIGDYLTN